MPELEEWERTILHELDVEWESIETYRLSDPEGKKRLLEWYTKKKKGLLPLCYICGTYHAYAHGRKGPNIDEDGWVKCRYCGEIFCGSRKGGYGSRCAIHRSSKTWDYVNNLDLVCENCCDRDRCGLCCSECGCHKRYCDCQDESFRGRL